MISTTFVQFQTTTSFPECSKQPPTFNLTCPNSLFFSNLLTGSFILLKLLFLKFPMTSSLRWIAVRSLAFFLTYSVLMAFHLIGPHLISHFVLRVAINDSISAFSTLSPGVYLNVPSLAHCFFTLDTTPLGSMISKNSLIYTVSFVRWWHPAVHSFTSTNSFLSLETPLSLIFFPG